jgi:hypothetical protein
MILTPAAAFQQMMMASSSLTQNHLTGGLLVTSSAASTTSSGAGAGRSVHSTFTAVPSSAPAQQQQQQNTTTTSGSSVSSMNNKKTLVLYLEQDDMELSPYQCLVRKQIEVFEQPGSEFQDEITTQGRNRPVVVGQVGLRCRHCAAAPRRARGKYSMLFPSTLVGAYQSAQNMANTHLVKTCHMIPAETRGQLLKRRSREKGQKTCKSAYGGGRQYWADCLRVLGVVDSEDRRLRFRASGGKEKIHPDPTDSTRNSSAL